MSSGRKYELPPVVTTEEYMIYSPPTDQSDSRITLSYSTIHDYRKSMFTVHYTQCAIVCRVILILRNNNFEFVLHFCI